jgi:hypothetical protein
MCEYLPLIILMLAVAVFMAAGGSKVKSGTKKY